jgi:hypothetical protein
LGVLEQFDDQGPVLVGGIHHEGHPGQAAAKGRLLALLDGVLIASRSGRANAAQAQFIWESTAATPWFDPEGAVQGGRFGSVSLTGKLWFDVDGTGHAARVLVATITGTGLSIDDLVVIA